MRQEVMDLDWGTGSNERHIPAFQPIEHLFVYDMRKTPRELKVAATTLAGIVNRPRPSVYLITEDYDERWLQQAFMEVPHTYIEQQGELAFWVLLDRYQSQIQGIIIYDPELIDTLNVATTMAGLYDCMVMPPERAQKAKERSKLAIVADLRIHGWTHRLQAYRWAMHNLLPQTSERIIAGLDPKHFCGLRSFLVATKAFVYWLDSRDSRLHMDESLLSERRLFQQILQKYPAGAIYMGWLIDEFTGVALVSQRGMSVVASDFFLNMEVFAAHIPEIDIRPKAVALEQVETSNKIYVSFIMSDGDNLQYCQRHMWNIWHEKARGALPIGWTIAPLLLEAAPTIAQYYLRTASVKDEFVCGPSGMGYVYPACMTEDQMLPFVHKTGAFMQRMGITSIQLLDSDPIFRAGLPIISKVCFTGLACLQTVKQRLFAHELAPYGVQGILSGVGYWPLMGQSREIEGIPLYYNIGMVNNAKQALALLRIAPKLIRRRPLFLNIYCIAWNIGPDALWDVAQQLDDEYEVVLPRTLLTLTKKSRVRE